MKKFRTSRVFSAVLSIVLAVSLVPSFTWAAETSTGGGASRQASSAATLDRASGNAATSQVFIDTHALTFGGASLFSGLVQLAGTAQPGQAFRIGINAIGQWEVDGISYSTLAAAVAAASSGDTITLSGGDISETSTVSIPGSKNLTIDLAGNTVSVSLGSTSKTFITTTGGSTLTVKNGTLQGNQDGRAISVGGTLNIDGVTFDSFTSSGNGGAVYVEGANSKLSAKDAKFFNNQSSASGTSADTFYTGGGALYLLHGNGHTISGCVFEGNSANASGGAVVLAGNLRDGNDATAPAGGAVIENSTFRSNVAGVRAGALQIAHPEEADVLIDNCSIEGNKAIFTGEYETVKPQDPSNYNDPTTIGGGGINIQANLPNGKIILRNTELTGNVAEDASPLGSVYAGRGGAIKLSIVDMSRYGMDSSSLEFQGRVVIKDNVAEWGGGIDNTAHRQATLKLTNVLITDNEAVRGAGIWLCPDGSMAEYSTLGGEVVGNRLNEGSFVTPLSNKEVNFPDGYTPYKDPQPSEDSPTYYLSAAGSDIVNEGRDSTDYSRTYSYGGVSVSGRNADGMPITWHADPEWDRYENGDEVVDSSYYKSYNSFFLHREPTAPSKAEEEYAIVITGNKALGRGGGIASNSPLQIGETEDTNIYAKKEWTTDKHPASVKFNLYREANGQRILVETVEVNEESNWEHRFANLPAYSVESNGERVDYTWSIEEEPMKGWAASRVLNIHQWIAVEEGTDEDPRYFHEDYTEDEFSTLVISGTAKPNSTKKFAFFVSDDGGEPYLYHEPWADKDAEFTVQTDAAGNWTVDGSRVPLWAAVLDEYGYEAFDDDWNLTRRTYTFMEWDDTAEKYVPVFKHDYQWGDDSKLGTRDYTMVFNSPVDPIEESIPVTKKVEGNPPADETFTFTIAAASEGAPMPAQTTATIKGAGTASFGPIEFDQVGTYSYTVGETAGSTAGYTYDPAKYTVTYEVKLDDAKLSATRSITKGEDTLEAVEFVNTYEEPEPEPEPGPDPEPEPEPEPSTPVDVVLVKHLINARINKGEFSFGLYDEEGNQHGETIHTVLEGILTRPSTDQYTSYVEIAFKDLIYYEPGEYHYTIREHMDGTTEVKEGDKWNLQGFDPGFYKGGVKYDDKEYPVLVTVSENEEGKLEASVRYSENGDAIELVNEYSETYVEIDNNDSHFNNGLHEDTPDPEPNPEPEPEPEPGPQPDPDTDQTSTPKPGTPAADTPTTPATPTTPKAGTAVTRDTNPIAPLAVCALVAASMVGLAFARRRKHE